MRLARLKDTRLMLKFELPKNAFIIALFAIIVCTIYTLHPANAAKYASILVDASSGKIVYADNPDSYRHPASLTKMMTLYLTFDALKEGRLKLKKRVVFSRHAANQAPSKLGITVGKSITVEDAILATITKSANDAAVALAETIAGSERRFTKIMNLKAMQLGMNRTHFTNASGLPSRRQITTVRDMAKLSVALIRKHNRYYSYFSRRTFEFDGNIFESHNNLLGRYPGLDGLKTGYIASSGFNLAASAVRDGKRLVCVVLGGPSKQWRDAKVAHLLDYGFYKNRISVASSAHTTKKSNVKKLEAVGTAPKAQDSTSGITRGTVADMPAASPAPFDTATAEWSIQVGAFSSEEAGKASINKVSEILPHILDFATPQVTPANTQNNTIVYRARITGMDKITARNACTKLKSSGLSCLAISPDSST